MLETFQENSFDTVPIFPHKHIRKTFRWQPGGLDAIWTVDIHLIEVIRGLGTFLVQDFGISISLRIQSECGKIRTTKTPNIDNFHAVRFMIVSPQLVNSAKRKFLLLNIVIYLLNLVLLWSRARLAINKKQRTLYYFWFLLKENKEIRANLWLNL